MDHPPPDPSPSLSPPETTSTSRGKKRQRESISHEQPRPSPRAIQTDPQEESSRQAAIATTETPEDLPATTLVPDIPEFASHSPYLTVEMARHSASHQSSSRDSPQYQLVSPGSADPRAMSQNNKDQLIQSLRTHKVNTITELRRIEKIFAYLDSSEVTEPMTAAWAHYVNSNNLLNELRGLTKSYPFSSECLDEAKTMVVRDPQSMRSWNYCWLVLVKVEKEGLIAKHARATASKPAMWGNRTPTAEGVKRLADACTVEWTRALRQMLRHWDKPPSTTGR